MDRNKNYLGIDFSTQGLKAVIINDACEIIERMSFRFDDVFEEQFVISNGVQISDDGLTVTVPVLMMVAAIDHLLIVMNENHIDVKDIVAISGCGHQHGSVYWAIGAEMILQNLSSGSLLDNLKRAFTILDSPVWMDSSTSMQCLILESVVGGPQNLADITGSRAYERFTGSQIMKIFQTRRPSYDKTERISLISSFICSLFLGKYAPIDLSDGSGMNLLNLKEKSWSKDLTNACGGVYLEQKLGIPKASNSILGYISDYFVHNYSFNPSCRVVAFTGDNPASLSGLRLQENEIGVSLGTSDTLFVWLTQPKPSLFGHVFVNPLDENAYMSLLCYKNGSLIREIIRDKCAAASWSNFNKSLQKTVNGNAGNIGIYFAFQEITPNALGIWRFDENDSLVDKFDSDVEVRALIEGQFIAKRLHAEELGFDFKKCPKIYATGGGSLNKDILQVLADVFNAPVYIQNISDSAALGCALRAKYACDSSYLMSSKALHQFELAALPSNEGDDFYKDIIQRYRKLERYVLSKNL